MLLTIVGYDRSGKMTHLREGRLLGLGFVIKINRFLPTQGKTRSLPRPRYGRLFGDFDCIVAPPVNEVEEDACFMTSTDSM